MLRDLLITSVYYRQIDIAFSVRYLLVLPSWPHSCFTKNICDFRYQAVAEAGKGWQESQSLQGKFFSSLFLVNILKITENLT
jgi:hypothetical protein